jgi:hypothetical protein
MTDIQIMLIVLGFASMLAIVGLHIDSPFKKEVVIAYSLILGFCSAVFFYVALFS